MNGELTSEQDPVFKKWEEDWANYLFQKYPERLGHPNFQTDGNARLIWSVEGFTAFQKLSLATGVWDRVSINGVAYLTHPDDPDEQRKIGEYTHTCGEFLWNRAKAEADRQQADLERQKEMVLERKRALEHLERDIQRIWSNQRLAFKETEIREWIRSAKDKDEETFLRQQLEVVQNRMIQLERRYQWLYGLGGLIFGFLGCVLTIFFGLLPGVHLDAASA
jgi:hypothetical protein